MQDIAPIYCKGKQKFWADKEDHPFLKERTIYFDTSTRTPRDSETGLQVSQLLMGVEKNTRIYFEDGSRLNLSRANMSTEPFEIKGSDMHPSWVGVSFRTKISPWHSVVDSTRAEPGWVAIHKNKIAGPFKYASHAAEAYNNLLGKEVNKVDKWKPKGGRQKEAVIQDEICHFLKLRGWYTHETAMGLYENGLPDIVCMHPVHGVRFVDVKCPLKFSITPSQLEKWPIMQQFGHGPYIMTAASEEEYAKLFQPCNYKSYFPKKYQTSDSYLRSVGKVRKLK